MESSHLRRHPHWPQAGFLVGSYAVLCSLVILAMRIASKRDASSTPIPAEMLGPWQGLAFLAAAILLGAIMIRQVKARVAWELILGVTLFLGVWFYAWIVFSAEIGLVVAAIATLLQAWIRKVWVHDAFILMGAAGVALNFAFLLPVKTIFILFFMFAIYDTFLAHSGGPIVRFAASLVHRGVIPGLVVPDRLRTLIAPTLEAVTKPSAVFLGAGDLILPAMLVAVAAISGMIPAACVTLGIFIAATWLGLRGPTKPFPALLPLAIGAGVPFFLLTITHFV